MSKKQQQHFDEINVGRMNIVDDNGTVRMVLSNKDKFPAPFEINGKSVPREGQPRAGVIFYNDEGIECGGLTFSGEKDENGEVFQQALLSLDPYLQNDAIDLGVADLNGQREIVLDMYDRPTFPITEFAKKLWNWKMRRKKIETPSYKRQKTKGISDVSELVLLKEQMGKQRSNCLTVKVIHAFEWL